jgi:hypothetical protein
MKMVDVGKLISQDLYGKKIGNSYKITYLDQNKKELDFNKNSTENIIDGAFENDQGVWDVKLEIERINTIRFEPHCSVVGMEKPKLV